MLKRCATIKVNCCSAAAALHRSYGIAWHFLTFTSPSCKLEFVYPLCCTVEEQMHAHLLIKFNAWMSQRLMNCNPIPKLTIVLIWRTPACLKFGKTSNRAVESLLQTKQRMMHALSPTELPRVFIWVVRGAMHSGKRERSALWLNAKVMNSSHLFISLKSWLCCCSLPTVAPQQWWWWG